MILRCIGHGWANKVKDADEDILSTPNSIPIKFESYGRKNVINATLSCRLSKTAMREHIVGVKPLSNGTGSSKKGANHPRKSVLIYYWYNMIQYDMIYIYVISRQYVRV